MAQSPAPEAHGAPPAADAARTLFTPIEAESRAPAAPAPPPAPPPAQTGIGGRGLFQRVTRLIGGGDSEASALAPRAAPPAPRSEPILTPLAEPVARPASRHTPADEAGLDIPAFLRRQAN